MKYHTKPVPIEAFRFQVDPMPDWFLDSTIVTYNRLVALISTLGKRTIANAGDWIVKDGKENIFPVKPEDFDAIYEAG